MNNIMKLAEAMAVAMAGDKDAVALIEARSALKAAVTALEKELEKSRKLVKAIKTDRHDWEDWPTDSREAFRAMEAK